jgi:hypothetical protein
VCSPLAALLRRLRPREMPLRAGAAAVSDAGRSNRLCSIE